MRRSSAFLIWLVLTSATFAAGPPANDPAPYDKAAAKPQGGPVLLIPEPVFDFGEILEGGEVQHDFPVRNSGSEVLRIDQVRPG